MTATLKRGQSHGQQHAKAVSQEYQFHMNINVCMLNRSCPAIPSLDRWTAGPNECRGLHHTIDDRE
jgi:hypothetical protein